MMLELVTPAVTYLEVIRAALIPAFIYYLALFLIVHFYSQRIGTAAGQMTAPDEETSPGSDLRGHRVLPDPRLAGAVSHPRLHRVPLGEPRARRRARAQLFQRPYPADVERDSKVRSYAPPKAACLSWPQLHR